MVVLSARFALLACLCAALPLAHPRSVEAAYLRGSHSSSNPHYRAPDASQAGTHNYDGKDQGHEAARQRAPELPPLLRRHTFQDYKKAQNHQDHPQPKDAPQSAFARSRYRRASGPHGRPSSIYVSGEHGDTYIVSRTPLSRQSAHAHSRRQLDEVNLALGRIDVMGDAQSSGSTQRLASLIVDSTPIDWASGQSSAKAFPLNASMTNQTQFVMIPIDDPPNAAVAGTSNKHVTLATEVFDANSAEIVMYCATYDPDPRSTSTLLMTPCTGETQPATAASDATDPCSDATNDAVSASSHQSQIFSYDPSSGKIEPISTATSSKADSDDPTTERCAGARARRDNSDPTTSGSMTPSGTSTSTAPTIVASQRAQNVTLVYVADALEVPASSPSTSLTNSGVGQAPPFTTTVTTTIMTTVTPTGPSRTATLAQAAVSIPVSSTPSSSTMSTTPSVSATASRSPSSLNLSGTVSVTATSKVPMNADESFVVEIVGATPPAASSSSSTSSSSTTTTTSHSTVSPTLDAMAVASSLANAMVHPQGRAFVSATGDVTLPRMRSGLKKTV